MKKLTALLLCVMLVTGICASVSFVKAEEDGFFEDFELYKNGAELPGAGVRYGGDFGLFWATPGEDTFTVSNERYKNGNKAAKIVANKNAADTGIILTNKLLKRIVKENDTYLFMFIHTRFVYRNRHIIIIRNIQQSVHSCTRRNKLFQLLIDLDYIESIIPKSRQSPVDLKSMIDKRNSRFIRFLQRIANPIFFVF